MREVSLRCIRGEGIDLICAFLRQNGELCFLVRESVANLGGTMTRGRGCCCEGDRVVVLVLVLVCLCLCLSRVMSTFVRLSVVFEGRKRRMRSVPLRCIEASIAI